MIWKTEAAYLDQMWTNERGLAKEKYQREVPNTHSCSAFFPLLATLLNTMPDSTTVLRNLPIDARFLLIPQVRIQSRILSISVDLGGGDSDSDSATLSSALG